MSLDCGSLNMIFDVFLSGWACLGLFLALIFLNCIVNLLAMVSINHGTRYKTEFSKQCFIKKFLLINNPNYPSRSFVVCTKINYTILVLLLILIVCHIVLQLQVTSIIVQILSIMAAIMLVILIGKIPFNTK